MLIIILFLITQKNVDSQLLHTLLLCQKLKAKIINLKNIVTVNYSVENYTTILGSKKIILNSYFKLKLIEIKL